MPPQSVSDSFWFLTVSLQVGAWQVQGGLGQLLFAPHTLFAQSAPELHFRPFAHLVLQLPPQSTSVSKPFCTPSRQLGAWQIPDTHTPLWQSVGTPHFCEVGHFLPSETQVVPPQSWSVSLPFFTPSEQVGAWHLPDVQTPLTQSEGPLQFWLVAQVAPQQPPQLQSVSQASFGQAGMVPQVLTETQNPPAQLPLVQSVPNWHFWPFAHSVAQQPTVQLPLPQSTSVSEPFCCPSGQAGARQMPPAHTLLAQSVPTAHAPPLPHRGQLFAPPQSTSVSFWFFTVSGGLQLGAWHVRPGPGTAAHTPLKQSPPQLQLRATSQREHLPAVPPHEPSIIPPQSTSVSISDASPF
jgi:hypothetical protein